MRLYFHCGARALISVLVLWFALIPSPARTSDFQLWTTLSYSIKVPESKFTLMGTIDNRFNQDVTNYLIFINTVGFHYRLFDWFSLGPLYRVQRAPGSPWENRVISEMVFTAPFKAIHLSNRNRFTARFLSNDVRFLYRNMTTLAHRFATRPVSFQPFIQDEFFVEPQNMGFNQNRVTVGNAFGFLDDHIQFSLYYRLQSVKQRNGWIQNQILGTTLGFNY